MIQRPIHLSHEFLAEVLDKDAVAVDAIQKNPSCLLLVVITPIG
ncbi:hypothetical protein ABID29_002289 [Streptococcus rupicaprae]|uniref:Uncharacterized protein n=1 Tax=Streptococcus rupicaprae TaxID=759619 RepID=A0ABV2FKQ3_9STRE